MKSAKILMCVILSLQFAIPAGTFAGDSRQQLETSSRVAVDPVKRGALRQDDEKLDNPDKTDVNTPSTAIVRWNDEDWSLSGKRDKNPDLFKEKGSQLFRDFGKRTAETKLVVDPLRPTVFSLYTRDSPRFDQTSAINWDWFTTTDGKITLAAMVVGFLVGWFLMPDPDDGVEDVNNIVLPVPTPGR